MLVDTFNSSKNEFKWGAVKMPLNSISNEPVETTPFFRVGLQFNNDFL